jgi:hypothetical protein
MLAALDVGIDWDTYEVWVEPGSRSTQLVEVQPGDIIVVKVINHDVDYAETVFYDQNINVKPTTGIGNGFPRTQVVTGTNDAWDFNEAGPNFPVVIPPAVYTTGFDLANAMQAGMNAAGAANTYLVQWIEVQNLFEISATNAGAIPFNVVPATGPNNLTSLGPSIGWTIDVAAIPPATARANSSVYYSLKTGEEQKYGHPLLAGDQDVVVLESTLYGILDPNYTRRVPLSIRRSRIVTRNRG